jgi:hypothetical protein
MTVLFAIAKDFVHLLMIINLGASAIVWAMGFRERFLVASYSPAWQGWFTLRRPVASEYSNAYRAHFRRSAVYFLAFVIMLGIGALLILLDNLLFKTAGC